MRNGVVVIVVVRDFEVVRHSEAGRYVDIALVRASDATEWPANLHS